MGGILLSLGGLFSLVIGGGLTELGILNPGRFDLRRHSECTLNLARRRDWQISFGGGVPYGSDHDYPPRS